MPTSTTCPFCNAVVPLPDVLPPARRIPCPRCGEAFVVKGAAAENPGPADARPVSAAVRPPAAGEQKRPQSKAAPLLVAGLVALTALVLVGVGIFDESAKPPSKALGEGPSAVVPWELPGLGYLPAGVDAAAGIHVAQMGADPRQGLVGIGIPAEALAWLEESTGLSVASLHHVAAGLKADPLQFFVVVATREAVRFDEVLEKVRARPFHRKGRTLYELRGSPSLILWPAGEHYLILALSAEDLEGVPEEPAEPLEPLPPPLRESLRTKVPPEAALWLVARSENLGRALEPLILFGKRDLVEAVRPIRALTLFAQVEGEPQLTLNAELASAAVGAEWRARLADQFKGGPPGVEVGGAGAWCYVRTGLGGARLRRVWEGLFAPAPKKPPG